MHCRISGTRYDRGGVRAFAAFDEALLDQL